MNNWPGIFHVWRFIYLGMIKNLYDLREIMFPLLFCLCTWCPHALVIRAIGKLGSRVPKGNYSEIIMFQAEVEQM